MELWSPPTSESRLEKAYFDEHFGPFFRTEQIILTAPEREPYNVTRQYPNQATTTYGGILSIDLLHQVRIHSSEERKKDNHPHLPLPLLLTFSILMLGPSLL